MGLEGKDLVKRDLKRKVKGLVIPHKIDFSNKKIKRWKSPEKNDEDLVKKSMKKEETGVMKADGKEMKSRKFMGRSRSKGKVEDMIIFHLEQEVKNQLLQLQINTILQEMSELCLYFETESLH